LLRKKLFDGTKVKDWTVGKKITIIPGNKVIPIRFYL
jgi:hypothetical protein